MFKILAIMTVLATTQLSYAQEVMDVGIGSTQHFNSGAGAYGVRMSYQNRGLYVPVAFEISPQLQQAGLGLGLKTKKDFSELFSYSIAAALNHLSYKDTSGEITEEDKRLLALLIKQEISFQLANRISLGINFDIDLTSLVKKSQIQVEENYLGEDYVKAGWVRDGEIYRNSYGQTVGVVYHTRDQLNRDLTSAKKTNATGFGLSLKFRLKK